MANHFARSRGPYTVRVAAAQTMGPWIAVATLTAAKAYAAEWGQMVDLMTVQNERGEVIAEYRRFGHTWVRTC